MKTSDTSSPSNKDSQFLRLALEEAKRAEEHDDIPVGAVLVKNGAVIAVGRNEREFLADPTAHAEVRVLSEAGSKQKHWNLDGATLYVTLEPCAMCCGALVLARVKELVYAAADPKGGAISLNIPILNNERLNHRVRVRQCDDAELVAEAGELLKKFFQKKRREKNTSGRKA